MDSRLYVPGQKRREPHSPVIFVYLGQLIHRKGIDLLLQAAARLRKAGENGFQIRLIGGGDIDWVRDWINRLQLGDTVEIAGFLSGEAIRNALGTADVFVLPTRSDTYAAVVHEAACMALPLLVSNKAGAAEALVQDGSNGFIFDIASGQELDDRMVQLMNPHLREKMSAKARLTGEKFCAHRRGIALWEWLSANFLARCGDDNNRASTGSPRSADRVAP
jgi:glycosyltransferase involved in cell wall biosynthesis